MNLRELLSALRIIRSSAKQKLGVDLDYRQKIVQLVGDVARDFARFLQIVRLRFRLLLLSDFFRFLRSSAR